MKNKPTEKDIERLLGGLQPKPKASLDERLQSAPWNQLEDTDDNTKIIRFPTTPRQNTLRVAVVIVGLLMMGLVLFSAPNQAFARQFLSLFFDIAPQASREYIYDVPDPTATIPEAIVQATLDARRPPLNTLLANASINVALPQYIPDGYRYESGYIDNNGNPWITFHFAEGDLIRRFLNIRYIGGEPHSAFEVGANAIIQPISINGIAGEYLQGSWDTVDATESDDRLSMTTRWNNDTELHLLSWYADGVQYEILYQASLYVWHDDGLPDAVGYLNLDELIAVAESIPIMPNP